MLHHEYYIEEISRINRVSERILYSHLVAARLKASLCERRIQGDPYETLDAALLAERLTKQVLPSDRSPDRRSNLALIHKASESVLERMITSTAPGVMLEQIVGMAELVAVAENAAAQHDPSNNLLP